MVDTCNILFADTLPTILEVSMQNDLLEIKTSIVVTQNGIYKQKSYLDTHWKYYTTSNTTI